MFIFPEHQIKLWCLEDQQNPEDEGYTGEEFDSVVYAEENAEYLDELEEEEDEEEIDFED
jgi:hypothetical protein